MKAAISRQENRKRAFEERRKGKGDQAKHGQVGEQACSLSLEKVLRHGELRKTTTTGRREPRFSILGDDVQGILGTTTDDPAWAEWEEAAFDEAPAIPGAEEKESTEEWEMRMQAQLGGDESEDLPDEDVEARRASNFRGDWDLLWSGLYGAFDDNSKFVNSICSFGFFSS
jgi:hypothetical protein